MAADFRIMRASCWTVALLCLQLANAFYIPGESHYKPPHQLKEPPLTPFQAGPSNPIPTANPSL